MVASGAAANAAQGSEYLAQSATDLAKSAGDAANGFAQYSTTTIGSSVHRTFIMGYSQKTELRADSNAVRYSWAAGYDPKAFSRVFAKLEDVELSFQKTFLVSLP